MQQKKMNRGRNDGKRKRKYEPILFYFITILIFFLYNHTQNQHYHTYVNFHKTEKRHKCSIFSCVLSKHVNCSILNNKHCYRQSEINVLYLFFLFKYVGLNTTYTCQRLTNYEEWIQQQHNLSQN